MNLLFGLEGTWGPGGGWLGVNVPRLREPDSPPVHPLPAGIRQSCHRFRPFA